MASFRFKRFTIEQDGCAMKVSTDAVLLGAWANGECNILDIGTGTGIIALMMAQRFAHATVVAIDIDRNACMQASANIATSIYANRVNVIETSLQSFAKSQVKEIMQKFDSIVSNPPFFVHSLKNPDNQRAVARHTDTLSYAELFRDVAQLLSDDGEFSVIIPTDYLDRFMDESRIYGLFIKRKYAVRTIADKQPKRYLVAFTRNQATNIDAQEVNLMDENGEKSAWYSALTADFYLDK